MMTLGCKGWYDNPKPDTIILDAFNLQNTTLRSN